MKIVLLGEQSLRLEPDDGPLIIEARNPELSYSAFHMLGGALGHCSFSVMYTWAASAGMSADDLAIEVDWTFADDPRRVGAMHLRFDWPSLPPSKLGAAKRVAELCAVHATLHHPPRITIDGTAAPPAGLGATDPRGGRTTST